MRNESDIFDEYAKLMNSQGLVSEAYGQEFRKDQYDLDAIEVLYGVKPNGKKDDESIIEKAHPETTVVGRSYDAMNAVVENEHQRQAINAYIATKMPEGRHTMRRYVKAKEDLMKAVVKAAYTLDNADETKLMKLADDCAGKLHKEAVPLALLGIPIYYWLAGATAAGTGAYLFGAAPPVAKNVPLACNLVLMKLSQMGDKPYSEAIHKNINKLGEISAKFATTSAEVTKIENSGERVDEGKLNEIANVASRYTSKASEVSSLIDSWKVQIDKYASEGQDETWGSWLNEQTKGIWNNLFGALQKTNKMKQALDVLKAKILESSSEVSRINTFVQAQMSGNVNQLENVIPETKPQTGTNVVPLQPAKPAPAPEDEVKFELAAGLKRQTIKRRGGA